MFHRFQRVLSIFLFFTAMTLVCAEEEEVDMEDTLAVGAESEDAKTVLAKTANETMKMRHTVSRVLHKSTEEVKTLKSLLTTNAKGAAALNELYADMEKMTKRIG